MSANIAVPPAIIKMLIGGLMILLGIYGGHLFKQGFEKYNQSPPNINFRRVAYFWINVGVNTYQIGAVIRLQNLGDKPNLVRGIALDATDALAFVPRGVSHLQRILLQSPRAEVSADDNMIKSNDAAYFRMLLPLTIQAIIDHPPPLALAFVGKWTLLLQNDQLQVSPDLSGTLNHEITMDTWNNILRSDLLISPNGFDFADTDSLLPNHAPQ